MPPSALPPLPRVIILSAFFRDSLLSTFKCAAMMRESASRRTKRDPVPSLQCPHRRPSRLRALKCTYLSRTFSNTVVLRHPRFKRTQSMDRQNCQSTEFDHQRDKRAPCAVNAVVTQLHEAVLHEIDKHFSHLPRGKGVKK
jgi:hypothetical protein